MKKICALLLFFCISIMIPTRIQAEITSEDYRSIGDFLIWDYNMTSTSYYEVYEKTLTQGNIQYQYYKTKTGKTLQKIYTINASDVTDYTFRIIPEEYDTLKTPDGKPVVLVGQIPQGELVELKSSVYVPYSDDFGDKLYAYYTLDGKGVISYKEYGFYGDINYIYLLADEEPPQYTVSLLPDSQWGKLTEWIENEYPTDFVSFQGSSGKYITLPECTYEKNGYTFDHWWDDYKAYYPGEQYRIPNRDCTLNAVWKKNNNTPIDTPSTPDKTTPSYFFPIINQIINRTEPQNDTTTSTPSNTYVCPYKDISGHWAEDIIKYISEIGLIDGITSTEFQPNEPMTREMFVTAVARLAGIESDHVNWAIDNGILLGYGNGEYGLTDTVTREQMAVFFLRFFEKMGIDTSELWKKDASAFADDESISDWATDAVYEIQKIGLIQGKENNLFDPKGTATRAEGATVLYNLIQVIMERN